MPGVPEVDPIRIDTMQLMREGRQLYGSGQVGYAMMNPDTQRYPQVFFLFVKGRGDRWVRSR